MGTITHCRLCQNTRLENVIDFGSQPLANNLQQSPGGHVDMYPLRLVFCTVCGHLQLDYTVDPDILFKDYVWVSGTSPRTRLYATTFYRNVLQRTRKTPGFVVEAASNDGTFLQPFKDHDVDVLGVDPAENLAVKATQDGIPTIPDYLTVQVADAVIDANGPADVVIARNVLPHVEPKPFVAALRTLMDNDSLLALEVHYAGDIYDELQYDSIYHEHQSYFTLQSLEWLLNHNGLYVIDLMRSPISGGSLVVYARRWPSEPSDHVLSLREAEERKHLDDLQAWRHFARRVHTHCQELQDLVPPSARPVAYGASARSSTLLNYTGIHPQFIMDCNPLKHGRYTPGTDIPIVHPDDGMTTNPSVILLLSWNFQEEIIRHLKAVYHYNKRVIVPFPYTPRVIDLEAF